MNAPLPDSIRLALEAATLDDKYTLPEGRAFMSGIQALVRLPMLQRQRDAAAGLNTAGFISGYRGSPLGGYDQSLWSAKKHLASQNIVFQPGVNEELAATAVWGTQQMEFDPENKKFDGVFGIWYGKGPGVDRCSDVFKHANLAGTAPHGGVIALAGDDHVAKSSTAAHQSDHIFKACGLPVFFPSSAQEILDLGLHAFAMSRFSGLWTSMKTIQEVVESSASIDVSPNRVNIILPTDFMMPEGGLHIRWPDVALVQEARLFDYKWYAALAYVRANKLNYNVVEGPNDRFGIIASGKAYNDTRQALADLGLDDDTCRQVGIRLHKVNVVWPLEASITRDFAQGLQEILVVEEKRQVIEYQLKEELYNWRPDVRPNVLGKFDEVEGDMNREEPFGGHGGEWSQPNPSSNWLLRANADLNPTLIAQAIAKRLRKLELPQDIAARIDARIALIEAKERALSTGATGGADRQPWFCSGCPHNTSTKLPEGSRAMAGIGCHFMATWMDRETIGFTQMGGEGVPWVGQSHFSKRPHMFANLGDGTYFHSGSLAVRQSIASGVNITYKILYNDAVAMTGGQPIDGILTVPQISRAMEAEGARTIVIVTDDPDKYSKSHNAPLNLAPGTTVRHRDELDQVQRELRELTGCTILIYDQTCATEKRRRRKRGKMVDPAKRVVINELVCEGCGDCSVQSNCLSVEPVETEFGRKRRINQNSCNKDYSCVKGFCPSFVTVEGGQLKKPKKETRADPFTLPALPLPVLPVPLDAQGRDRAWGIVVAGVGGTGVITIGSLLGMAAHLEGKGVVTQDSAGLAQKGGATWSHIQIARTPEAIHTTKVDTAKADLVIACDGIVAAGKATLSLMREGSTYVAMNNHATPTAAFVHNADWQAPTAGCEAALIAAVGRDHLGLFDAEQVAVQLLGDSLYTNPLLLGFAWQKGRVPLGQAALFRAFELNGTQVDNNKAAFEWGRRCAHDLGQVQALFQAAQVIQFVKKPSLTEMVAKRVDFLTGYQNAAYAQQYADFVAQVRQVEAKLNSTRLTEAVARYLFKLMAYKDEYEVARLHTDTAFTDKIAGMFEGDYKLVHHLAPPLLGKVDAQGQPVKQAFGPWIRSAFGMLAKLKGLRGTAFDVFGRSEERRTERALITEYQACIGELLAGLDAGNLTAAVEIAGIPEDIRGYGHVKARHLAAARPKWARLMAQWRSGGLRAAA
jgi:indolepyruvate ferredoxin oxidoreductase